MGQQNKFPVSLGRLQKMTGLTKPAISRILRGVNNPKAQNIKLLADALGMSVEDFYRQYVWKKGKAAA